MAVPLAVRTGEQMTSHTHATKSATQRTIDPSAFTHGMAQISMGAILPINSQG